MYDRGSILMKNPWTSKWNFVAFFLYFIEKNIKDTVTRSKIKALILQVHRARNIESVKALAKALKCVARYWSDISHMLNKCLYN